MNERTHWVRAVPRLLATELALRLPPVAKTGKLFDDNDTLRALLLFSRRCRCSLPGRSDSGAFEATSLSLIVELIGIEPTTSGLQSPRSPS
jgi:hypothetical protein